MKKTRDIVIISIYVALILSLDVIKTLIPFLNMPSGGSVNIALIPLAVSSFHLGIKKGLLIGFLWFVLSSIIGLNTYFISFGQIIFDYILPSVILGLSSVFYSHHKFIEIELGIFLMMTIRTLSIIFSGAYFWYDNSLSAFSLNAWMFSISYNLPYSLVTLIMLLIIVPFILETLKKYLYNK